MSALLCSFSAGCAGPQPAEQPDPAELPAAGCRVQGQHGVLVQLHQLQVGLPSILPISQGAPLPAAAWDPSRHQTLSCSWRGAAAADAERLSRGCSPNSASACVRREQGRPGVGGDVAVPRDGRPRVPERRVCLLHPAPGPGGRLRHPLPGACTPARDTRQRSLGTPSLTCLCWHAKACWHAHPRTCTLQSWWTGRDTCVSWTWPFLAAAAAGTERGVLLRRSTGTT